MGGMGDVFKCPEDRGRHALSLKIPDERFLDTVDDLAHVYERRYHELAHGAIVKEKQWKARDRRDRRARFTKKQFPMAMGMTA